MLFMNNDTSSYNLTLPAPAQGAKLSRAVQTTDSDDFADVSPLPSQSSNGTVSFELPGRSLYTLQFTEQNTTVTKVATSGGRRIEAFASSALVRLTVLSLYIVCVL